MSTDALRSLLAGPEFASLTDEEVAAALISPSIVVTRETLVTERTLYGALGPEAGEAVLAALDAAAAQLPVIARVRAWLKPAEGGIDVGHPATRAQLDAMSGVILDPAHVAAIKALAEATITPLQSIDWDGNPVSAAEVAAMRAQ